MECPLDPTAFLSRLLDAQSVLVYFLLAVGVDYILGTLGAYRMGTLNSSTGKKGTVTKVALLVLAFFLVLMEPFFTQTIGLPVASGAILMLMIHELESIAENVQRCGVDLPAPLLSALEKARAAKTFYDEQRTPAKTAPKPVAAPKPKRPTRRKKTEKPAA
jgi:toxin secretion/phage lysis holin